MPGQGSCATAINIWVGLPMDGAWNGRLQSEGGGGYAGRVNVPERSILAGYVGIQTDTGHTGGDGSFAMLYPGYPNIPLQIDFSYRSLHLMAVIGKQLTEAEDVLEEAATYCRKFGYGAPGLYANAYLGVVYFFKGQISRGLEMLEEAISESLEKGRKSAYAQLEHTLGKVYLQLAKRTEPSSFSLMAKDIGFLLQNINSAGKNAENHLNKAIEVSKEIGARGVLGPDYLDLGLLHKAIGEKDRARRCLSSAIQVFVECKAETCLKKAREELKSLITGYIFTSE